MAETEKPTRGETGERRGSPDRRKEDLPVGEDRRKEERRSDVDARREDDLTAVVDD